MSASGGGGGGVGGALSLMGCVREASPPPQDSVNQGDFSTQPNPQDNQPKETKRRRFHPLRGLRKIFRRKSRGAADLNAINCNVEGNDHNIVSQNREDVTMRNPAGRPEESRSRSASDLLTDSCDKDSVFRRRSGIGEALAKLRGGPGQLSISHDSVFPGEVPYTRPLSTLDPLATLERIPSKVKESESKETSSLMSQRHRVSLQVLEQMKTVIESRNQVSTIESSTIVHNFGSSSNKTVYRVEEAQTKTTTTKSIVDDVDKIRSSVPKEDLPELESNLDPLTHEAAKHRITVRPKNRRPPNRVASQFGGPTNMRKISESSEALDTSLDTSGFSVTDYPVESKNVTVIRKSSSSRMIRSGGEIVGELESKLQRSNSPLSKSPDSLDSSVLSRTSNSIETTGDQDEEDEEEAAELVKSDDVKPAVGRKLSNRISKGSDIFAELSSKLPRRRSSVNRLSKSPDSLENTWSKSTDSFERLEESVGPKPAIRKSLNFVSKSTERVSKSSDSLEALESLNAINSDDSIERRRSSYEFRGVQRTSRAISKSSESFGPLNETRKSETTSSVDFINQEDKIRVVKRSSTSDVTSLTKNVIFDNITLSKSSENVDPEIEIIGKQKSEPKRHWRPTKRMTVSSESSDNLELDDELENRRARKPAKRIPSTSFVDIQPSVDSNEAERKPPHGRKLSRFKKSSESSELGSTDTVDSDKKNKSSASVETIDSLERDLDHRAVEEEDVVEDDVIEKRVKNEKWSGQVSDSTSIEMDETKPLISEKSYWRESSEAKENIDIHQLLALTIVTHIADNGNQRNSVLFPKKKLSSAPTSPEKQDDNKIIFNNLLSSKNDEDLQNMLNGNISEVSTDTKSFKEKLIMFEKLGK